jgi:hypothetical protein
LMLYWNQCCKCVLYRQWIYHRLKWLFTWLIVSIQFNRCYHSMSTRTLNWKNLKLK